MAISANEIIYAAIGFILLTILVPIGMSIVVGTSTTSWNSAVVTMFQVLVPILYIIGCALYFVPKFSGRGE